MLRSSKLQRSYSRRSQAIGNNVLKDLLYFQAGVDTTKKWVGYIPYPQGEAYINGSLICCAGSTGCHVEYLKPRSRCKMTCINQATAEAGEEPMRTLNQFR